jgi:hypothetical protein
MNCDRCPLEDTNDCKKCDPVEELLRDILEQEERRISGEQKETQEKIK